MLNVGCQPPWRRFSVEGLPICDNSNLLTQFGQEYNRITQMVKNELIEETKCLVPCTFMEYKVIYIYVCIYRVDQKNVCSQKIIVFHELLSLGCINFKNLCVHHQEEVLRFPKHPQLTKFA